jgi:hypothetical protein
MLMDHTPDCSQYKNSAAHALYTLKLACPPHICHVCQDGHLNTQHLSQLCCLGWQQACECTQLSRQSEHPPQAAGCRLCHIQTYICAGLLRHPLQLIKKEGQYPPQLLFSLGLNSPHTAANTSDTYKGKARGRAGSLAPTIMPEG